MLLARSRALGHNAPMKSFRHSLKVEDTLGKNFATRAAGKHCVFAYIEGDWYAPKEVPSGDNTTRMHSCLGYKSPAQFERDCVTNPGAANDEQIIQHGHTARLSKKAA